MTIYPQVEKFIKENAFLINSTNKYDWEDLYNRAKQDIDMYVGELTQVFLDSGINPLIYLDHIPSFYMHSNTELKKFIIPDSIKSIGGAAFSGCNKLEKIIIPNNVTDIQYRAFRNCHSLKEATIPCKEIDSEAFIDSGLEKIYLSNNIKEIFSKAFYNCYDLVGIIYEGTSKDFKNIYVGSDIFGTDTNKYIQRYITFIGDSNNRSDFNLYVK